MAAGRECGFNTADFSETESVLSDCLKRCSLEPQTPSRSTIKPINSSQLCERTLETYYHGGVSRAKVDIPEYIPWNNYSPDTVLLNDSDCKKKYTHVMKYTHVIKSNIDVVADFCVERALIDRRLGKTMEACLRRTRFQRLLEYYPIEFGNKNFKKSFNQAYKNMKDKLTANLGEDIQRNVSVMLPRVMHHLNKCELINIKDFKDWCIDSDTPDSDLLNDAMNHTTAMIRSYVKLLCLQQAKDFLGSKEDEHEVWKSIITELTRYAGVLYSMNAETKRYFFSRGNHRVVVVKADLEIMMSACLTSCQAAGSPRIIAEVCGEDDTQQAGVHAEGGQAGNATLNAGYSSDDELTESSASEKVHNAGESTSQKDSGFTHGPVRPKIVTRERMEKAKADRRNDGRQTARDSSSSSPDMSRSGHLHMSLPDCISDDKNMAKKSWVTQKLFVQHAAHLMTVQQSLQYSSPGFTEDNKGQPVIGLFMIKEKIFFTKLTGNEESGRKFTVSNWFLRMDRFADRVLLMVFLCAYCKRDININTL